MEKNRLLSILVFIINLGIGIYFYKNNETILCYFILGFICFQGFLVHESFIAERQIEEMKRLIEVLQGVKHEE